MLNSDLAHKVSKIEIHETTVGSLMIHFLCRECEEKLGPVCYCMKKHYKEYDRKSGFSLCIYTKLAYVRVSHNE